MKSRRLQLGLSTLFLCFFSVFMVGALYGQSTAEWTVPITVVDGAAPKELEFGTRVGASDGFDAGIDMVGPPAGFTFEAVFKISGPPIFSRLLKDFRDTEKSPNSWTLHLGNVFDAITGDPLTVTISWDASGFPAGGDVTISHAQIGTVDMLSQSSVEVVGPDNIVLTINYNAPPVVPIPSISISDETENEDSGTTSFTVSLSEATTVDVSVDFTTTDGTAGAPDDYTATSGTLTILAGNTTGTIDVTLIDDTLDEDAETFMVDLSNPVNGTIADNQGLGTIIDNDPEPTISISDETENEDVGTMSFTVSLSAASSKDVSVDFTTTDGTAGAPDDYTATSGTLTILAGSTTGTIDVTLIDDALDEDAETF
ncbi:MAG: Calx-beta domain-containing protein, partial [bacterium]